MLSIWMLVAGTGSLPVCADEPIRPNIILINLDDADVDLFSPEVLAARFPNINQLANEGIRFTNCHVTTPLCGPSRASLLRGQYAHASGVKVTETGHIRSKGFRGGLAEYVSRGYHNNDLGAWMKQAGYHTALIGKYINNGEVDFVPSGWDEFYASNGNSYYGTSRFTTRTSPQGQSSFLTGTQYRTSVETADCLQLLNAHVLSDSDQPFFFYLAPLAPHLQAPGSGEMYDLQFANWWPNLVMPEDPDFDEADFSDKPAHLQVLKRLTVAGKNRMHREYRDRVLSMISIDRMIAQIRHRLAALDELDNTYIILTSDNGYQLGHHRETGKVSPYNRCTKVPLIVWGPDVPLHTVADHLIAHIDLTSTILDLAGGNIPAFLDGLSFKPLIEDPTAVEPTDWRFAILIENWQSTTSFGVTTDCSYVALRTYDEIYTEYSNGSREYYDLSADPFQLDNAIESLSPEQLHFFRLVMRQIKGNPVAAITTLADDHGGKTHVNQTVNVQGIVEHRFGVKNLRLSLRHFESGNYWNGWEWQEDYFANQIAVTAIDGQLADWNYSIPIQIVPDGFGHMIVSVRPVDSDGQAGPPRVYRVTMDRSDPETHIQFPTTGAVVSRPLVINGHAYDQSEIHQVRLVIRNLDTGLFFNGQTWIDDRATLIVTPQSKTFWKFPINPPVGRYWISARAYDAAGNFDQTPATRSFRVE